ncbi:MAG: hypothetical protein ACYDG2_24245 [Ruminiclostridium sp.]
MYFQKLEQLSEKQNYSKLYPVIDSLDTWLVLLPKSYTDKIIPTTFARTENVPLTVVYMLFDELLIMKLFKQKYILRCPTIECKHVLFISADLNEIQSYILKNNENKHECSFCDGYNQLSTDNIFLIYELIDQPSTSYIDKKKDISSYLKNENNDLRNLTDLIKEHPEHYRTQLQDGLIQIVPNDVQKQIQYVLEG